MAYQNQQSTGLQKWNGATMIAPAKEQAITNALKGYTKRIHALVGDESLNVNQLMASVVLAVAKNDYLLNCDPTSLILAVLQGAREGIRSFSGPYAGGYLVPFGGKVTLIHNYKFLMDVALECGAVAGLSWGMVRENDTFEYEMGTSPFLRYKKCLTKERGAPVCSWAVATLPSGEQRIDVLELEYLDRIREDSLAKIDEAKQKYSPWIKWAEEMVIKTQIRHVLKTCGLNFDRHNRLVNIMENDDRAMLGQVAKEFAHISPQARVEAQDKPSTVGSLTGMAQGAIKGASGQDEQAPHPGDDAPDPLADLPDALNDCKTEADVADLKKHWIPSFDDADIVERINTACDARISELKK